MLDACDTIIGNLVAILSLEDSWEELPEGLRKLLLDTQDLGTLLWVAITDEVWGESVTDVGGNDL